MHSNWKIWDFFHSRKDLKGDGGQNLIAFQTFDPFAFKIIKDHLVDNSLSDYSFRTIMGKDVTPAWLEDNFLSLGLFGNSDSYLILGAENLSKDCKDILSRPESLLLDDCLLLLDYSKEDDLLKKLKKSDVAEVVKIDTAAFWEYDKLLDFLCGVQKVYLSYQAKNLILQKSTPDIATFYNVLSQVSINFPEKMDISAEDIEPLVATSKIDQFELAELFASKRFKPFYEKVSNLDDFEDMRRVFLFMQSHLLKVFDPSYLEKKPRLTKYDKQIKSQSNAWQPEGLRKAIDYFAELEFMAKTKDDLIRSRIKRDKLRVDLR